MSKNTQPQSWKAPLWHADFGDPLAEFLPLKILASRLIMADPNVKISLQTPEPGLVYLTGELPNRIHFEVYSVPSAGTNDSRRIAIFLYPDTEDEIEKYFEAPEAAIAFVQRAIAGPAATTPLARGA